VDVGLVASVVLIAAAILPSLAALYLLVLAIASFRRPASIPLPRPSSRLVVLVPAHDEAELLPRCLASLQAQSYPSELVRIVVIADNCSDDTASVAGRCGATVMVRDEPALRGKGQALRWAMDQVLAEREPPDAVVLVDADSVAEPELLTQLEGAMARGAEAVQGDYQGLGDGSRSSSLRQAAFLLFHRTRFGGRAALGLPCALTGNGMLLRRVLLERVPWNAYSAAEDLEYTVDLRLAGVRPAFARHAQIAGPVAGTGHAAATQRMRWEGGRLHIARSRLPILLDAMIRQRRWSLLDAAVDLAVPPLGMLVLLAVLGTALSLSLGLVSLISPWAAAGWIATLVLLAAYVTTGLRAARAPAWAYRALLTAPGFLMAKLGTYLRMTGGLGADRWERTERPSESGRNRVRIAGVPVDSTDERQAVERILAAVGSGSLLQVCTVNLQFLVTARRHPEVRQALCGAGLNVADGAPVVWLSRLLGRPLPGRVTGADLVTALVPLAESGGIRLFLLGGTGQVAAQLAGAWRRTHPRLLLTGSFEPPISSLEQMEDDEIIARIREAGADILLVALGHPKQDLWIAANRDRLPVSVAIGVGGTFDILAGRFRRAPLWARRHGLEWLCRLVQEPQRLGLRYALCAIWLVGVLVPVAAWQRLVGVR
jgi:1,2-diacylglycerol 3-beta-glucosyltransferase